MLARRTLLLGGAAVLPAAHLSLSPAFAVDALPDARFVGYAQSINDFEIGSGRIALAKSMNENVRGFANRMVAEYTEAAQFLSKARQEAGVSYAPDPSAPPNTQAILQRLSVLEGPEFDTSYANAQLAVTADWEQQVGAYSQSGGNGALRRYAQGQLPKVRMHLEYAQRLAGGR